MNRIPVLMYHALEDQDRPAGAKDPGEQLYVLPVERFRWQMEYLHREGFRTFLFEELSGIDKWPDRSVIITFDDGHVSNYSLALPTLKEFGFRAEFFITTGWIGSPRHMTEEQIRTLSDAGMGIGSHGVTHRFFNDLTCAETEFELMTSQKDLSAIIGKPVTSLSAPGGRMSRTIETVAKELGYDTLCTSQENLFKHRKSFYVVPRFAIRHTTDINDFKSLMQHQWFYLFIRKMRSRVYSEAKFFLGNGNYNRLRKIILK